MSALQFSPLSRAFQPEINPESHAAQPTDGICVTNTTILMSYCNIVQASYCIVLPDYHQIHRTIIWTWIIFVLVFSICSPLTQFVCNFSRCPMSILPFLDFNISMASSVSGKLLMMMAGELGGITIGWRELPTIYFDNLCLLLEHAQTPRNPGAQQQ